MDNWRESDINVDSLWLIPERGKGGKHKNVYHGNFIPQIPNQLIRRYTKKDDLVLELFSGSGTTLYECETLERNYIGYDINIEITKYVEGNMEENSPIRYILNNVDVTDKNEFAKSLCNNLETLNKKEVDFMIAHPPYLDIVKFTNDERDLSHISDIDIFISKLTEAIGNGYKYIKKKGYFAVVMGDVYKNSAVVPLSFLTMEAIRRQFQVQLKGIIIKNIEGNRGKLGKQDIWRYRALKSDYFLFKHEYIFIFKKL